ncbi:LexA family transcriptional regulator [Agrobacterium pusense]|uniref:LexA family transcriptional regulator n=1 Tax=Agrobacterium pusense TaxID=648995 RepID=UPI000D1BC4E1|nr:LexA family transcriptional regulator [Agrobacterium pusense]
MPNWEEDTFRERVRDAIQAGGKSGVMSKRTGIPVDTLNKYVALRSTPSAINALKIAEALGLTLEQLAGGLALPTAASTERAVTGFSEDQAPYREADVGGTEPAPVAARNDSAILEKLDLVVEQLARLTPENSQPKPASYAAPPRPPATVTYLPFRASAGGGSVVLDDSPGLELDIDALSQQILRMRRKNIRLIEIIGDSMLPTFMSGDVVVADTSFPRRDALPDDGELYVISKDGELLVKRALWVDTGVIEWRSDNPEFTAIRVQGDEINQVKIVGKVMWLWRRAH